MYVWAVYCAVAEVPPFFCSSFISPLFRMNHILLFANCFDFQLVDDPAPSIVLDHFLLQLWLIVFSGLLSAASSQQYFCIDLYWFCNLQPSTDLHSVDGCFLVCWKQDDLVWNIWHFQQAFHALWCHILAIKAAGHRVSQCDPKKVYWIKKG